jgi:hypothetical protein
MYFELVEEQETKQEPTLAEMVETISQDRGLKPYVTRSRFYNMEIVLREGKRLARTKNRTKSSYHAFWVDDELYKEYLAEGRKPVEV